METMTHPRYRKDGESDATAKKPQTTIAKYAIRPKQTIRLRPQTLLSSAARVPKALERALYKKYNMT